MIRKMGAKEAVVEPQPEGQWVLYILHCQSDTFYTGVTKDIDRRLRMHHEGKASRYTRVRRPVRLIYYEHCTSRAQALIRECEVKALSRRRKEILISSCLEPLAILKKGKDDGEFVHKNH
jgi:putative endonuclease